MLRTALKPRFLGLLGLVLVVGVAFVLLGRWQLGVAESTAHRDAVEQARAQDPAPITTVLRPQAPFRGDLSSRPVTATGQYAAEGQLLVPDRRLELMLVCAHPAIAVGDRTPLMLNTVLGFTAEQVARSYAVPTSTMATRLVRAKHRIRDNRIPFRLPDRSHLPERMDAVLAAVYAAYVIEWSTGPGERDLPPEALHLAEVLAELVPDDAEVHGLAALVELSAARRPGRLAPDGRFVPLASQDTALWDADLIARAHGHLRAAHPARVVGRYQLEAAVQAVHCARRETGRTDWPTLLELHRSLAVVAPSLGSATALAAVTAEVEGPAAGLALLDADAGRTKRFQPAWATRAELLTRLGRDADAAAAYDHAIALTHETPERRHLEARSAALRG